MKESMQKQLSRNRPPRVQITYDLEVNNDVQKKELPLVVGILADLAGDVKLPQVKARKFVDIDRDNFNAVMKSIGPSLAFTVDNRLDKAADTKLAVKLRFEGLEDLRPESLIQQVDELRELFKARQRLNDLITKLDGNDNLDRQLQEIVKNPKYGKDVQQEIKGSRQQTKEPDTQGGDVHV